MSDILRIKIISSQVHSLGLRFHCIVDVDLCANILLFIVLI